MFWCVVLQRAGVLHCSISSCCSVLWCVVLSSVVGRCGAKWCIMLVVVQCAAKCVVLQRVAVYCAGIFQTGEGRIGS